MKHRHLAVSFAALVMMTGVAAGDLRGLVGDAEYEAMGLAKLDADEQARLLRWFEVREQGRAAPMIAPTVSFAVDGTTVRATMVPKNSAPVVAAAAAVEASTTRIGTVASFGLDQDTVDGEIDGIRARVVGEFTGWEGKTVFTLDNGQVWRQSTPGSYRFKATDPEVTIEKSLLGYKLRLVETKRSISVRRVK